MSDKDPLDALFGESEPAPATPEAEPAKQPDAEPAQPRDENGRFAAKDTQSEAAPASAAPETPVPPQEPAAPAKPLIDPEQFKGYLEEREKRQKLEAENKALRERVEQQTAKPIPSFSEDPEGYAAHVEEQLRRTAISNRFDASEFAARQAHGDDSVQKAMDWGMERSNASQAFATEYIQQRHPVDWIVKQYKRDQLLSQIGDRDPREWARELLAQEGAQASSQMNQLASAAGIPPNGASVSPQPAAPQAPPPTPSLASAPSAGGLRSVPMGPGVAFDALFQK